MTMGGQIPHRSAVLSISNAKPCVVVTTAPHGYLTGEFVRFTNLQGMDELDGNRYLIFVLNTTTFQLQNPITFEYIDSTNFPPYIGLGSCNRVPTYFYYHAPEDQETDQSENSDEDQDEDQTQEG